MKRTFLPFLLLLIGSSAAQAQDYYPVKTGETTYFGKEDSTLFLALKIDSSKTKNGETTHYLPKQLREVSPNCARPTGDSWLGDTVHTSSDGWATFVNGNHKPFQIFYRAALGASWQVYSNKYWRANAKVTSHTEETFLGMVDSVKTIVLDIRKLNDSDTSHPYDGVTLKLSKNHGLLQLVNFYAWDYQIGGQSGIPIFPEDKTVLNLSIVGMQQAQKGLRNLTAREIYNYEVGDEWIEAESHWYLGQQYTTYTKKIVLSKELKADTVVYSIRRLTKSSSVPDVSVDTILSRIYLSALPELPNAIDKAGFNMTSILRIEKQYGRRVKDKKLTGVFADGDRCWPLSVSDQYCFSGLYIEGIGGPYGCNPISNASQYLVYYKKGNVEWGTPIIVLGVEAEKVYDKLFQLYPNPARGQVQLRNLGYSGNVSVVWYTIQGRQVKEHTAQGSEAILDMSELPSGIYVYEIRSNEQVLKKGRTVLQ